MSDSGISELYEISVPWSPCVSPASLVETSAGDDSFLSRQPLAHRGRCSRHLKRLVIGTPSNMT